MIVCSKCLVFLSWWFFVIVCTFSASYDLCQLLSYRTANQSANKSWTFHSWLYVFFSSIYNDLYFSLEILVVLLLWAVLFIDFNSIFYSVYSAFSLFFPGNLCTPLLQLLLPMTCLHISTNRSSSFPTRNFVYLEILSCPIWTVFLHRIKLTSQPKKL